MLQLKKSLLFKTLKKCFLHFKVSAFKFQSYSSFHPLPPHFLCCTDSNLHVVMLAAVLVRQQMRKAALKNPLWRIQRYLGTLSTLYF